MFYIRELGSGCWGLDLKAYLLFFMAQKLLYVSDKGILEQDQNLTMGQTG